MCTLIVFKPLVFKGKDKTIQYLFYVAKDN